MYSPSLWYKLYHTCTIVQWLCSVHNVSLLHTKHAMLDVECIKCCQPMIVTHMICIFPLIWNSTIEPQNLPIRVCKYRMQSSAIFHCILAWTCANVMWLAIMPAVCPPNMLFCANSLIYVLLVF